MNYDELSEHWKKDSKLDLTDITTETVNISLLHAKYYHFYITEGIRLKKLESERAKLSKDKYEYYSGTMDIEDILERGWKPIQKMIMETDVQRYLDADSDLIEMNLKIGYVRSVVDYIESILKMINSRGYNLRLIFDIRKFESGN